MKYAVYGIKFESTLTKFPVPNPSTVFESDMVGVTVLQHTPRAVTGAPPSEETVPPLEMEVAVILFAVAVVSVGIFGVLEPVPLSFLQLVNNTILIKRSENQDTVFMFFHLMMIKSGERVGQIKYIKCW